MIEREVVQPTPERKVFGQYETIQLPVTSFVRLPQVRTDMNPALPDLKQSIETNGLINPIDVARMDGEHLSAYIDFVNRTWKTGVGIDDYAWQKQADGNYYLVIAGHTRTEAIAQLQAENEAGYEYDIIAKVHSVTSPAEIISLQLDENIHSLPPQEQRAIAVVEAYYYGVENGMWHNESEFMKQAKGRFSRKVLSEAIGFAKLPVEARDFVFSKRLSYNAAVALGGASDTLRDYVTYRLYGDIVSAEQGSELETAYRQEVGLMIAGICNSNLNGPAAKKFIGGQVAARREYLDRRRLGNFQDELFDFELFTPDQQARAYTAELEKQYRAALKEMERLSIGAVDGALRLHGLLGRIEGTDELREERDSRHRQLGSPVVARTISV